MNQVRVVLVEGGHTPGDEAIKAVQEMLLVARYFGRDMSDLKRRLQTAENGKRLALEGLVAGGTPWRARARLETPEARTGLAAIYDEQIRGTLTRMETMRAQRAMLNQLLVILDELETRIISLRWLDGKPWQQVSTRVFMCVRHCQRIQKRAIERMAMALEAVDYDLSMTISTVTATSDAQNLSRK